MFAGLLQPTDAQDDSNTYAGTELLPIAILRRH